MKKPADTSILPLSLLRSIVALGAAALLAGCASKKLTRDLMSEEANADASVERPVAMRGESTFFEGKLATVVTISRGFERQLSEQSRAKATGAYEITARDMKRKTDDQTELENTLYSTSEDDQKRAYEAWNRQVKAQRAAGSPMPPVTLRVQLENRGTEPLEVEVTDVNSNLGNFAVRPPRITLAPGEAAQLDPMISQLGVTSDEIPLQLGIRLQGKKETQVVPVKNVIAASVRQ